MERSNLEHENARKKEKAYIIGRQAALALLALGTALAMFRLGTSIAEDAFPDSFWAALFIRTILVGLSFFGVDFIAQNALSSASDITSQSDVILKAHDGTVITTVDKGLSKRILQFGVLALVATITISAFANYFVSSDLAGESQVLRINERMEELTKQDSITKLEAFNLIAQSDTIEQNRIKLAETDARELLAKAVGSGSISWQKDYYAHKNNPKAWFWTCQECAIEYQAYRDRIKKAIKTGEEQIAEAKGYGEVMRSTLSPTLSYQLSNDSSLVQYANNILYMEKERKAKGSKIFWLLTIFTVICGIVSFAITLMLREHRKYFGQHIVEDAVTPIEYILDMITKIVVAFRDSIYTVFSLPYRLLLSNGWITAYQFETSSESININKGKMCQNGCGTNIEHMKANAKFCGDDCRNEYHNRKK